MRVTQGAFSFLPDLTDEEIRLQVEYCLEHNWAVSVEHTDDPHPRNTYWEMWGAPMFDLRDAAGVMSEITACRKAHASEYVRVTAFDNTKGIESVAISFIVNRPAEEPGFYLTRAEGAGRSVAYTINSYAVGRRPEGDRYGSDA